MIPLNDQTLEVLRTLPMCVESPYGLSAPQRRPSQRMVQEFRQAGVPTGIGHSRYHDLRHTFASHLVMRGMPWPTVSQWLGHTTGQMTVHYAHLSIPHAQETVTILETALISTLGTQLEGLEKYTGFPLDIDVYEVKVTIYGV